MPRLPLPLLPLVLLTLSAASAASDTGTIKTLLLDPVDAKRDRTVPLKVYLPESKEPQPVVLFSHGLGGSRENNHYLGNHWAEAGYVCVFMQHIGSDESVWKDARPLQRMRALKGATGIKPTMDRLRDVPFVIDQLEKWSSQKGHALEGRMDLDHIGLAGHSYGAVTTLGLTDRDYGRSGLSMHEKRIDAFLPMSPQPGKGENPEASFGKVSVPVLCMTGTKDGSPIDPKMDPTDRQKVYQAFPKGDKFQLVFEGAEHFAFGDSGGFRTRGRNPNHHPTIQKISTHFWNAYLRNDKESLEWLQSDAPKKVGKLAEGDTWKWK